MSKPTNKKIVCVSGGFDPVHIGHLRMIQAAAQYGNVVAIVNSDDWLMRKKGYIFMPFEERCEILKGFNCVDNTTSVEDTDGTVCEALARIKPDYFANGGDRKTDNTPEMAVCEQNSIELLWNMGGGKIQSSSDLVSSSGMVRETSVQIDGIDLKPAKIQVIAAGDVSKSGDY